ncbi:putative Metallo-beta-lactamase domain protein [Rhodotorula toruloides]|nr:putative Metallo-beta-lactamase domain protein [Rhodotorula toruloides]
MRLPAHIARSCCSHIARSHSSRFVFPTHSRLASASTPLARTHTRTTTASAMSTVSNTRPASTAATTTTPLTPFRTHTPSPTALPSTPLTHVFWDTRTSTWTYLVVDPSTRRAAIIDSVLDFDPQTNTVSTESADGLVAFIEREGITVERILETHAHADHLTAAAYLQLRLSPEGGPKIPIGIHRGIRATQAHFAKLYDVPMSDLEGAFDEVYDEGDEITVGECKGQVWHLPGHTECSGGYVWGEYVYTGDSVLLPAIGSARVDFPAGSASRLYSSSQRLLSLPSHFRLFSGHNYPSSPLFEEGNRCSATVREQRELNRHFKEGTGKEEFVRLREERDRQLQEPRLLHQSLQVNIRAGRLPKNSQGKPFFRIPVHAPAIL